MSETTEKALWIKSPLSNKIGTILWGISAILVIFTFTNLLTMGNLFSKLLENDAVAVQSDFLKFSLILTLPFFVIFTVLSIGMFLGSNTCTALAKSYGISLLIFDIAIILGIALLISIIAPIIAGAFAPLEVFLSSFTGFFDQIKSLINSYVRKACDKAFLEPVNYGKGIINSRINDYLKKAALDSFKMQRTAEGQKSSLPPIYMDIFSKPTKLN